MSAFIIHLTRDRGEIDCDAQEVTTRVDGSLWLLAAPGPRPAAPTPVLILAAGTWWACHSAGADPLSGLTPPQQETMPPKPGRLLPALTEQQ